MSILTSKNQKIIVGISFSKLLLEELDTVRGDIPRSKYIARLLEKNFSLMEKET
jgi:metal-responsive CopG/Arc/MetJ family transcriptional regulator